MNEFSKNSFNYWSRISDGVLLSFNSIFVPSQVVCTVRNCFCLSVINRFILVRNFFNVFGSFITIMIISLNRVHRFHLRKKQYIVCEEETSR